MSLAVVHDKIILPSFGYAPNYHAYEFLRPHRQHKCISYGCPHSQALDMQHVGEVRQEGKAIMDAQFVYLDQLLMRKGDTLRYVYDLGNAWHHTIKLERIVRHGGSVCTVLGGQRSGPPEDCDGNKAYVEKLQYLSKGIAHLFYNL